MRIEDVIWRINENSGFDTARFDTLLTKYDEKGNQYRAGKSINIARWPANKINRYKISGQDKTMHEAGFKVWLCNKCQVAYNEWGEF